MNAEIEHLKNTLIGVNDKVLVLNDLKLDIQNHKAMLQQSEQERGEWQIKVRTISTKVVQDSEAHTVQKEGLIRENLDLKKLIEQMTVERAKTA